MLSDLIRMLSDFVFDAIGIRLDSIGLVRMASDSFFDVVGCLLDSIGFDSDSIGFLL